MKIKIYISVLLVTLLIYSCKSNDSNPVDDFDHAAQAIIDDVTIREYLETHLYIPPSENEPFGTIDTLETTGISLLESDLMNIQTVNLNDIDYKLYYLKNVETGVGSTASRVDSVLVKYQGLLMDYSQEPKFDERISYTWLILSNTISGWSYGFPNYKAGINISVPDMPLEYEHTGKGMLFIPSGLAYRNIGTSGISPNKPIMFHIELAQVEEADHDGDGISSNYEDLDHDGDYTNDDTNDNTIPNYLDFDDDGDRILTKFESADPNGDGNPSDALDTDGDGIPNFLDEDDDGDGRISIRENADPNGDGNPEDALDTDGDGIPDYLDPDTN